MDGGGFGGPNWSVRVSLANLNDEDYAQIGNYMRKSAEEYVEAWKASKKKRLVTSARRGEEEGPFLGI